MFANGKAGLRGHRDEEYSGLKREEIRGGEGDLSKSSERGFNIEKEFGTKEL
jgi:hypothetical protein